MSFKKVRNLEVNDVLSGDRTKLIHSLYKKIQTSVS